MELTVKEVKVIKGLNKAARLFGCSKGHLSLVIRGQRTPGAKLAGKLRKAGIELKTA